MVRHVILWKLKEMPDAEKAAVKAGIKEGLDASSRFRTNGSEPPQ